MEWVIVSFPSIREVWVDDVAAGMTNRLMRVSAGTHVFSLGMPHDYAPATLQCTVRDTTVLRPLQVVFTRNREGGS